MSHLLELLGSGLLGELLSAFEHQLPEVEGDDGESLAARRRECPESLDLALRAGVAWLRELRLTDARKAFEDALRLAPSPVKPALGLACVYDEMARTSEALHYLHMAHVHEPDNPAIAFAIAFCKERGGELADAEGYYRRAIAACPRLRNAHERLAAIAIRRRDLDDALHCYQALAELEPADVDILMRLGTLYLHAQRPLDAIVQFERALLIEPHFAEGGLEQVEEHEQAGRTQEAIAALHALVARYPGVPDFHVHLGDLLARLGDERGALREYRAALELQPRYLEALIKLGTHYLRTGAALDAARTFQGAIEVNDRLMEAYVGLSVAQCNAGREEESRATLDLVAGVEPNSTLLFAESARIQMKEERERSARGMLAPPDDECRDLLEAQIERHRQALVLRPNHADLHYRYGLLLRQVGRLDEAIDAFQSAVAINPAYVKALIKLGVCLRDAGRADDAQEAFRAALTLRDDCVDAHYELGLLFAQRQQFDLAVEAFEHGLRGGGAHAALRANLALALQNIGMLDRAAAAWRSICDLTSDVRDALSERESRATSPAPGRRL